MGHLNHKKKNMHPTTVAWIPLAPKDVKLILPKKMKQSFLLYSEWLN